MKKIIILLLIVSLTSSFTQDQIRIKISSNPKGELMLNISGHSSPVVLEVEGKTMSIEPNINEVNLKEQFKMENSFPKTDSELQSVETKAGETPVIDSQNPVPPIMSNSLPSKATPI